MSQMKRFLPHLRKAVFVCVGVAVVYWWIADGGKSPNLFTVGGIVNYSAAVYFFDELATEFAHGRPPKGRLLR